MCWKEEHVNFHFWSVVLHFQMYLQLSTWREANGLRLSFLRMDILVHFV